MACDTAFRVVTRRCVEDLTANHAATCEGDPAALHQMRVALTHLRTAISFFSPMVVDAQRTQVQRELKWLNAQLGDVRDIDVAIERLARQQTAAEGVARSSTLLRAARDGHRRLARTLRSARYRRLIETTSGWAENGPWSITKGKRTAQARALSIATYSARKLARWQQKLLKKSRKLGDMGKKERHRLRLMNKRLSYSAGFFKSLFRERNSSSPKVAMKYLRKAQKMLGQLNDDATGQTLAAASGVKEQLRSLTPKQKKRLIRRAAGAYRKLAALKPAF